MSTRQSPASTLRNWLENKSIKQSELAEALGVTRAAVSKWCGGLSYPSPENALVLQDVSFGAIPATIWPVRSSKVATTTGASALHREASKLGLSMVQLAERVGMSPRSLMRWASGEYAPRSDSIATLNKHLGLSLKASDFAVAA